MAILKIDGDSGGAVRSIQQIEKALGGIQSSLARTQRSLGSLQQGFASIAGAVIGGSLFKFIDDLQNMENKLRIATSSQAEFQTAMEMVRAIADKTGQSLTATGDLYAAVARNASKLGYDTNQVVTVTNAMATALRASGTSAQGSASTLYQFSQILAKGKVNGDEFTTIMENLGGPVMDLVAKNMGITTAELVKYKEKGLIGAKDFTDALIRSMGELDKMGGKASQSIGMSLQRIQNAFGTAALAIDNATGFSSTFADMAAKVAANGENLVPVIKALGLALGVIGVILAPIPTIFAAVAAAAIYFADVLGPILKPVVDAIEGAISALVKRVIGLGAAFKAIANGENPFTAYSDAVDNFGKKVDTATKTGTKGQEALAAATAAATTATSAQAGQLTGVGDKYKEILKDLQQQLAISSVSVQQFQIENQLLTYKKQLEGQISTEQETQLRNLLQQINANKLMAEFALDFRKTQDEITLLGEKDLRAREVKALLLEKERQYGTALSAIDKERLATQLQQLQAARDLDSINQSLASYQTPLGGSQAGASAAGQMASLDPVKAAMTANQTLYNGLEYLRNNDLISEQAYQRAKISAASQAQDAIMAANKKTYENMAMLRIQEQTGTMFGYETQKQMAQEAAAFEMKSSMEKAQFGIEQAASMFSALGQQNRKAFEASKALNIGMAIMNTYMAATKAFATFGGWPFGAIAAAATIAMGMAQVASIRSQQYSGRQLGGPVMGGQSYVVGENGPEIFTPNSTGSITPNGKLGDTPPTQVVFNINANDTRGFDELLSARRGLITQIIRDAQSERGQKVNY